MIAVAPSAPSEAVTTWPFSRAGGGRKLEQFGLRAFRADRAVKLDIGERELLIVLFLGAHDAFERWVARLVDRLRHADERGQRRRDAQVTHFRFRAAR